LQIRSIGGYFQIPDKALLHDNKKLTVGEIIMKPLKLTPAYKDYIWGGEKLRTV